MTMIRRSRFSRSSSSSVSLSLGDGFSSTTTAQPRGTVKEAVHTSPSPQSPRGGDTMTSLCGISLYTLIGHRTIERSCLVAGSLFPFFLDLMKSTFVVKQIAGGRLGT